VGYENVARTDPAYRSPTSAIFRPKCPASAKPLCPTLQIHANSRSAPVARIKSTRLGFALENFNAAGEWRAQEGHGVSGPHRTRRPENRRQRGHYSMARSSWASKACKTELLKQQDLFLNALAGRVYTYALGRELGLADAPETKAAVAHMKAHGTTLRSLIQYVVASPSFKTK